MVKVLGTTAAGGKLYKEVYEHFEVDKAVADALLAQLGQIFPDETTHQPVNTWVPALIKVVGDALPTSIYSATHTVADDIVAKIAAAVAPINAALPSTRFNATNTVGAAIDAVDTKAAGAVTTAGNALTKVNSLSDLVGPGFVAPQTITGAINDEVTNRLQSLIDFKTNVIGTPYIQKETDPPLSGPPQVWPAPNYNPTTVADAIFSLQCWVQRQLGNKVVGPDAIMQDPQNPGQWIPATGIEAMTFNDWINYAMGMLQTEINVTRPQADADLQRQIGAYIPGTVQGDTDDLQTKIQRQATRITREIGDRESADAAIQAQIGASTPVTPTIRDQIQNNYLELKTQANGIRQDLDDHRDNVNNPHLVTLPLASAATPANTNIVLSAGTKLYEGGGQAAPGLKYQTLNEVKQLVGDPVRFVETLKFIALTTADMNAIAAEIAPIAGDLCYNFQDGNMYQWSGTAWTVHTPDHDWPPQAGDMYQNLFYFGAWTDENGQHTYAGEVSAQIIYAGTYPQGQFNLQVLTHPLQDDSANDNVIGPRTLVDQPADSALVGIGPSKLTAFLQAIRNNLKSIFTTLPTLATNIALSQVKQESEDTDTALQNQIDVINARGGRIKGTGPFASIAILSALPANSSAFGVTGLRVGDYAFVNPGLNNAPDLYQCTAINGNTATWNLFLSWPSAGSRQIIQIDLSSGGYTPANGSARLVIIGGIHVRFEINDLSWSSVSNNMRDFGVLIPQGLRPDQMATAILTQIRTDGDYFPWPCSCNVFIDGTVRFGRELTATELTRRYFGVVTWTLAAPYVQS